MLNELSEARKLTHHLISKNVAMFEIVSFLNEKFEGFFYSIYGNVFHSNLKGDVADSIYLKGDSNESRPVL